MCKNIVKVIFENKKTNIPETGKIYRCFIKTEMPEEFKHLFP